MSKYGTPTMAENCVETKKHLKQSIKREKRKLKDFIDISENMDMPWELKQQAVGSLYIQINNMKRRLKEHYGN